MTLTAAVLIWVLAPPAAHAQSWEVSGFIGHTPSANLERQAPELDELSIRGGFSRGAGAARLFFRYKPTMLNDEDVGDFCDPFGFCQGTLSQGEVAGGAVVRF